MDTKRFSVNILLAIVAFTLSLVTAEIFLRRLPISDRFGWNSVPPLEERVRQFKLKRGKKIVCLGDSFIEWRAGENVNMLVRVQKNLPAFAFLNLGRASTNLDRYIHFYNRFVHFKPDAVLLFIYLGNDVRIYPGLSDIEKESVEDAPKNMRSFLKKNSILLGLIFRFLKFYIPSLRSGLYEDNVLTLQAQENVSDGFIRSREKNVDARILHLAKADMVNATLVSQGVVFPRYFQDLFSMRAGDASASATLSLIRQFRETNHLKNFAVVFIPECVQVSSACDAFYKNCAFDLNDFPTEKRRRLNDFMRDHLQAMGIKTLDLTPFLEKGGDVYLRFDNHLNAKGHRIAADQITRFVESEFLNLKNEEREERAGHPSGPKTGVFGRLAEA